MSFREVKFTINSNLFIKDPQETNYGKKLLASSIDLMNEIGYEQFTFKKLADRIDSAEASIYRYFQNKHNLLLYITCWYWEWMSYVIDLNLMNVDDKKKRLRIVIHDIVHASSKRAVTEYINEQILHELVIKEGSKSYHIHGVDAENELGYFSSYKELVLKVSEIIKACAPKFRYPKLMASNLFEMANNQIYFADHLPKLTDVRSTKNKYQDLEDAMLSITQSVLKVNLG